MTFQKGNTCWNNLNSIACRIKPKQHLNPETEFKKGIEPINKGKGTTRIVLNKYGREKAIKLYGNKCIICSTNNNIRVHHINKNWHDNSYENVVPICPSCHGYIHGKEGNKGQFKPGQKPWNYDKSKA